VAVAPHAARCDEKGPFPVVLIDDSRSASAASAKPMLEQPPPRWAMGILTVGVALPLLALVAAVPIA
jgi:hypothetical protein